jgi:prephenate dehydrogenase
MRWKNVAIIGVGLIGGSVGLALRRRRLAGEVIGIGRRTSSLRLAARVGAVTSTTTNLAQGVRDAQLVVVCSPVERVAEQVLAVARHCPAEALITDAASTKTNIVRAVAQGLGENSSRVRFVGSHPIAGGERSGAGAARDDLFTNRLVVVTPLRRSQKDTAAAVESFWKALGAQTIRTTPQAHDRILALTSHMPHVVAAALAAVTPPELLPFTGAGWADTTRIAAGDAALWQQILADNRRDVVKSLDRLAKVLARFRAALLDGDSRQLIRLLKTGKKHRDALGN